VIIGWLERRGLRHYWRTHLAVIAGVAVATSVLAGALIVGESVRHSLSVLALSRIGRTEVALRSTASFGEALAGRVASGAGRSTPSDLQGVTAPLLAMDGVVLEDARRRRATHVAVYGVDGRFWQFHGVPHVDGPVGRQGYVSPALAGELGLTGGDTLLVTVEAPSDIPPGVLQGRRADRSRTLRLQLAAVLARESLGEFALRPTQADVRAVFVPLALLQRELDLPARVNVLLAARGSAGLPASGGAEALTAADVRRAVTAHASLDDLGVRVRTVAPPHVAVIESAAGFLNDPLAEAALATAAAHGLEALPVLGYLATSIRRGDRAIPYSVVSGLDLRRYDNRVADAESTPPPAASLQGCADVGSRPPVWLNTWAADDLDARPGDVITLEYDVWSDEHGLTSGSADFTFAGSLPMSGAGADRTLLPEYPGLTDEVRMTEWDPPFPVDLRRIRPEDERYWEQYRTAAKAFVSLACAQDLWRSRYGRLTSVRVLPPAATASAARLGAETIAATLRAQLDPFALGQLIAVPVREEAEAAAQGTTDFGEYFLYFTLFLVVAALLLTGLLFRLNLEQRLRELGLLRAVGFSAGQTRSHFLGEGLVLGTAGAALGLGGAVLWATVVMTGLRTWWFDAVGTDRLALHVSWIPLSVGAALGWLAGLVTMWWMLASLARLPPRTLLGALEAPLGDETAAGASVMAVRRARRAGALAALLALGVLAGTIAEGLDAVAGFFVAGVLGLTAALCLVTSQLRRDAPAPPAGGGAWAIAWLGARQARLRPGRSVTAIALVAVATFIIIAVGAFRRDAIPSGRASGTGGYALIGEASVPILHDPGTPAGRDALNLPTRIDALANATFTRLRLRPGDDASCLTLYRPQRPRLAGVPDAIVDSDRFRFRASLAATDEERSHPWRLLRRRFDDGAIAAIGDFTSLTYVFHLDLGDTFTLPTANGSPLMLRIVAMLDDSIFQSELLIAERAFVEHFPQVEGYRLLLVEARDDSVAAVTSVLEDGLSDHGLDLQSTADRLRAYHRVENTYISTFQVLGGLGLLLGTCGIGALLLRGVMERKRELAVLRAVGYRPAHLALLVVGESAFVAGSGALIGAGCALLAIAPALEWQERGLGLFDLAGLPLLVLAVGLLSSLGAVAAVTRLPVAETIRTE
jgi:ABC-type antimicrobial peptide transport system permease subunit